MSTNIVAKVTAEGKLEIPSEVLVKLQPLTEYEVSVTENEIVLKKITKPNVDLDEFLQGLEDLESDPNQLTLEEISEVVKDVRQELWSNP
ncbi:MAG: hypothetical protein RM368_28515 [Nostoc sp. DedSLP03]|uniref:hypothetical protein n=1 Tax=Nostoc sp. DedSLP03 TaxID=3075400 RepID=UPI002AD4ABBA|nr:hypothetical protein [Nostoc sp. DedSLP03]MDZ7968847.1 hypothetical protein [Nostoc sp. DedSLP03]